MTIKEARKAAKLSQQALADAAGINIRQIQRLELNEIPITNMTFGNVAKIADALNIDPRDLL